MTEWLGVRLALRGSCRIVRRMVLRCFNFDFRRNPGAGFRGLLMMREVVETGWDWVNKRQKGHWFAVRGTRL